MENSHYSVLEIHIARPPHAPNSRKSSRMQLHRIFLRAHDAMLLCELCALRAPRCMMLKGRDGNFNTQRGERGDLQTQYFCCMNEQWGGYIYALLYLPDSHACGYWRGASESLTDSNSCRERRKEEKRDWLTSLPAANQRWTGGRTHMGCCCVPSRERWLSQIEALQCVSALGIRLHHA